MKFCLWNRQILVQVVGLVRRKLFAINPAFLNVFGNLLAFFKISSVCSCCCEYYIIRDNSTVNYFVTALYFIYTKSFESCNEAVINE